MNVINNMKHGDVVLMGLNKLVALNPGTYLFTDSVSESTTTEIYETYTQILIPSTNGISEQIVQPKEKISYRLEFDGGSKHITEENYNRYFKKLIEFEKRTSEQYQLDELLVITRLEQERNNYIKVTPNEFPQWNPINFNVIGNIEDVNNSDYIDIMFTENKNDIGIFRLRISDVVKDVQNKLLYDLANIHEFKYTKPELDKLNTTKIGDINLYDDRMGYFVGGLSFRMFMNLEEAQKHENYVRTIIKQYIERVVDDYIESLNVKTLQEQFVLLLEGISIIEEQSKTLYVERNPFNIEKHRNIEKMFLEYKKRLIKLNKDTK